MKKHPMVAFKALGLALICHLYLVGQTNVKPIDLEFQILPYRCLLECPEYLPKGQWYGLYYNQIHPGSFVENAKLKAVNVKIAECNTDAFGMLTGPKISHGNDRDLRWVIRGLKRSRDHAIRISTVKWLYDPTLIHYDSAHKQPFVQNGMFKGSPISITYTPLEDNENSVVLKFRSKSQELGRYGGNEGEAGPAFLGDLDGDGLPDLIINMSYHYAASTWYLFLSSKATKGELVKEVSKYFDPAD